MCRVKGASVLLCVAAKVIKVNVFLPHGRQDKGPNKNGDKNVPKKMIRPPEKMLANTVRKETYQLVK